LFTLLWGVVLIGGALLFTDTKSPVVELGLKIASFTYGGLLGTFFLGLIFKKTRMVDAYIGFIAGLLTMIAVICFTKIDYTWHTFIGCLATILVGNISYYLFSSLSKKAG
jgi:Na+/proline symporter